MGAQSAGTRKPEASVAASFSLRVFDRGAVAWREKDRSLKAAATKSEAFLVLTQSVGTRKNRFGWGEAVLRIEKVFRPKAPELIQLGVEHVEDILSGRPLHQFVSDDRIAGQPVEPALHQLELPGSKAPDDGEQHHPGKDRTELLAVGHPDGDAAAGAILILGIRSGARVGLRGESEGPECHTGKVKAIQPGSGFSSVQVRGAYRFERFRRAAPFRYVRRLEKAGDRKSVV